MLYLLEEYLGQNDFIKINITERVDPVTAFQSYMDDTSVDDNTDGDVYCWKNEFAPVAERIVKRLACNRS